MLVVDWRFTAIFQTDTVIFVRAFETTNLKNVVFPFSACPVDDRTAHLMHQITIFSLGIKDIDFDAEHPQELDDFLV